MKEFFAQIYELGGFVYFDAFSNDMYQHNLYFQIFLWLIATVLIFTVLYYKILDRPKLAKVYWWLLIPVLFSGIISFLTAYGIASNSLASIYSEAGQQIPNYSTELFSFACLNSFFAAILTVVFSIIIKGFSTNLTKVPF